MSGRIRRLSDDSWIIEGDESTTEQEAKEITDTFQSWQRDNRHLMVLGNGWEYVDERVIGAMATPQSWLLILLTAAFMAALALGAFTAGRVSASRSGSNVIPAIGADPAASGNLSGLSWALPSSLSAGVQRPMLLGGASHVPTETASPGVATGTPSRSGSGSTPGGRFVRGIASWYRWHPGEAAAGPSLRHGNWRGRLVTVCGRVCLRVQLTDWCACPGRLIDLDYRSFSRLAPLSQGLMSVSVTW